MFEYELKYAHEHNIRLDYLSFVYMTIEIQSIKSKTVKKKSYVVKVDNHDRTTTTGYGTITQ